jgi:exodeoxyribonuclease V alpha subunit
MPVMIVHNDPALDVNNGDLGIIFPDAPDTVWLPSPTPSAPPRSLPRLLLPDLAPAWATTVHKSQGSEYATVAIVLPDSPDCPLLTREILYTAVTRTTSTVHLWSSESSLRTCILRPVVRASGFSA